jgi:glycosyltransferase involved in cell wall biosynthesis
VGRPAVLFDLVAMQSPSYRGRGIARYSTDLVRAMVKYHPDLVAGVVVHPELGEPEGLDDLVDWVTTEPKWGEASVLHLSSAFEPEVAVRTFWPREASQNGLLVAVTLYDLIPELFPGWYLEDPGLRRRWRCCRETVRCADRVFTLSESARLDAIALLGIPASRVKVVGGAPGDVFRPPASRRDAFLLARSGVEELEEGFVIYNGAFNPRKNVDRLVQAYATLPRELIEAHQLVIVCEAPPLTRNHYLVMAKELGVDGRVLITGFVPEDVLVALYQSAALAVYPSLYEGYGLPLVESIACGTPTVGGDNSSLAEILPREARFEPTDPGAIAEAISRGLTDQAFRAHLLELTRREPPSWEGVADRAARVFEEMFVRAGHRLARWRQRAELALVGLPPDLVGALSDFASCDVFTGLEEQRFLAKLDPWRGGYDALVLWAGGGSGALQGDRAGGGSGTGQGDSAGGGSGTGQGDSAGGDQPTTKRQRSPRTTDVKALERFIAAWPGRCIALVGQNSPAANKRALSRLERAGARVLCVAVTPAETARQVVKAATDAGRRLVGA